MAFRSSVISRLARGSRGKYLADMSGRFDPSVETPLTYSDDGGNRWRYQGILKRTKTGASMEGSTGSGGQLSVSLHRTRVHP